MRSTPDALRGELQPPTWLSPVGGAGRFDGTSALTGVVVVLLAIPSQLVFAPLGAAGSPAQLLGAALALWWVLVWLMGVWHGPHSFSWIRVSALALLTMALVSYVAAMTRPIDGVETRAADRALISLVAWIGVLLVAADGIPSEPRLDALLRRLTIGGGLYALLGLLQFVTGNPLVDRVSIPGLTANQDVVAVMSREGFARPASTAIHPIEFGVVMTLILPLALHYAVNREGRSRLSAWWPVVAIGLALPMSLSRSAILGSVVVLLVVLPGWQATQRRLAYGAMLAGAMFLYVAVPGLIGTITKLFVRIGNDGSARSRTDSYDLAWEFVSQSPWVGRGLATFLPRYRILDNQYLGLLIELGFIGLTVTLSFLLISLFTGWMTFRTSTDPVRGSLARSLTAGVAAGAAGFATFDAFAFPQVPTLLFLLIGCVAALSRLSHEVT